MKGSEAKQRGYASKMPIQGEKALYKVAIIRHRARGQRGHVKTTATEEPAAVEPAI
jgi:hypothetical protein